MLYEYDDEFLVSSIEETEIEKKENEAIIEIEKLNISDVFYKEKLTKARVYMLLAREQLENEYMRDKYNIYEKEFNRYLRLSKNNNSLSNISTIPLARG